MLSITLLTIIVKMHRSAPAAAPGEPARPRCRARPDHPGLPPVPSPGSRQRTDRPRKARRAQPGSFRRCWRSSPRGPGPAALDDPATPAQGAWQRRRGPATAAATLPVDRPDHRERAGGAQMGASTPSRSTRHPSWSRPASTWASAPPTTPPVSGCGSRWPQTSTSLRQDSPAHEGCPSPLTPAVKKATKMWRATPARARPTDSRRRRTGERGCSIHAPVVPLTIGAWRCPEPSQQRRTGDVISAGAAHT